MSELLRLGTRGVIAGEGSVPGRPGLGGVAASPAHVRIPGQAEEEPGDAAPGPPRARTLVEGGHDQGGDERQHPDPQPDLDDPRHGNGDRTQLLRRGRFGGAHTVSVDIPRFATPRKHLATTVPAMATTSTATAKPGGPQDRGALDRFFQISERGSTMSRELRGGLVTFFTMAYIVVLNPLIIGTQADSTGAFLGGGDIGPAKLMVAAATALVVGVVANFPLALATGLGLNAFVAFGIAKLPGMTWADAMGLVVIEGIIITILVLPGFRKAVLRAVPTQLKTAISVGIGLFITFIGLVDAGFVRKPRGPVPVELGIGGFLVGWPMLVFVAGLLAIIAMMILRVKGAILIGIVGATILAIVIEAIFKVGSQTDATGQVVT